MILAILQARASSTRLPRKVLAPILGAPMLARQLERLAHCGEIDRLVVATSVEPGDDEIVALCRQRGVECYRGSLDDVLDRFYRAATRHRPEQVVRLTGDCPLADPALIDELIRFHCHEGFDYSSNCHEPSLPDGLDAEIIRMAVLETAWREACLPSEREHVTPFIRNHPERFRIGLWKNPVDLSRLRWTVDEPADLDFVRAVYEALYPHHPRFGMQDVLELLARKPELVAINAGLRRNAGFEKSLRADAQQKEKSEG
ncbi:cytidylyltransferase domain-containing protein [Sulfuricystis multivorans]|uniref:cytidylyltransferase domain-containing protein n=1 Tax=Sulfuricystis multivorans TaxID=2211108 RepID=UPI000F829900|nr:glycosyltransferase family protein [Sulfuricystis multivorans]